MSASDSVVLCLTDGVVFSDPDPQQTERQGVRLVHQWDDDAVGVVGWSDAGWDAVALASAHPEIPRLAIVSTPFAEHPVWAGHPIDLSSVAAKTLLIWLS